MGSIFEDLRVHIREHKARVREAEATLRAEYADLVYDAEYNGVRLFPAKLSCGCVVTQRKDRDGWQGNEAMHLAQLLREAIRKAGGQP